MKPSNAVTKKARKSSRYHSIHRHVHVPNRASSSCRMPDVSYGNGFMGGILHGLSMLFSIRHRTGKHAKGHRVTSKGATQ